MDAEKPLSKKERRELAKKEKVAKRKTKASNRLLPVFLSLGVVMAFLVVAGFFIYKDAQKPLPGQTVADLGRDHVNDISKEKYNSNPPTSGPHFPIWAKKGLYDEVLSDGYLIHSLEHGYIVVSYDCDKKISAGIIPAAYAHEAEPLPTAEATESARPLTLMRLEVNDKTMSGFTPESAPRPEVTLSERFKSAECKELVGKLTPLLKDYPRLVIVPRPGMDTPIALTAWDKILKLKNADMTLMKQFADAYHNRGPEATNE